MHYHRRKPKPLDFTTPAKIGRIVSALILLYFFLVSLDYFLAISYNDLHIKSYEVTTYSAKRGKTTFYRRGRSGGSTYYKFEIKTDKIDFSVMSNDNSLLPKDKIKCEITPIFKEVISCYNTIDGKWNNMQPHHIYSPMYIFFVVSAMFAALPFIVGSKEYQMLFSIAGVVIFIVCIYLQKNG